MANFWENDPIVQQGNFWENDPVSAPRRKDWSEISGNIGPSAMAAGKGYLHALNPMNYPETVSGMVHLGSGALAKIPGVQAVNDWAENAGLAAPRDRAAEQQDMALAGAVGQGLYDRAGTLENIRNTIITDPVGAGLDVAMLASGGAGLVGRGPMVANRAINAVQQIQKMPRAAETLLRRAAPKNTQVIDKLGDEAMLLDAGPGMTGLAQGVAVKPSPHSEALIQDLIHRMAGRTRRLEADRVGALGKARDPELLKTGIDKAAKRASGPFYKSAKANAPSVSTELDNTIAREAADSAGMTDSNRKIIFKVLDSVDDARNAATPKQTAERLHNLRQVLDAKIVYGAQDFQALSSADKAAQAPLKRIRKSIDDVLKNNLPGFKRADEITAKGKKAQEDVDYGVSALEGGKYAHTPERFNLELNRRDPTFVREGMKADIRTAVGTQANDLPALRKKVGGDNDFNRDKLAKAFGRPAVDRLTNAINREELFGQNFADISRNSQTARRLAAQQLVDGTDAPRISQGASIPGLLYGGAAKGLNALLAKGVTKYSARNAEALAKALALKGADARKLAAELAKSNSQGDKLRKIVKALISGHVADTVDYPRR